MRRELSEISVILSEKWYKRIIKDPNFWPFVDAFFLQ